MDKHVKPKEGNEAVLIRAFDLTTNLVTAVYRNPFTEVLVHFDVICELYLSLITSTIFIEFLKKLYPAIEKVLPTASNTIRKYIIEMYIARKKEKLEELGKVKGMIHFSFDLWTSPNHLALIGIIPHYINNFLQNRWVCLLIYQLYTLCVFPA